MKKLAIKYLKIYNTKTYSQKEGKDIIKLEFDKVKHGFVGDIIKLITIIFFGNLNNWGANEVFDLSKMWWLYLVLIPLVFSFIAGVLKETYDKNKGYKFDWEDVVATTLPFVFIYNIVELLLGAIYPDIEEELKKTY